MTLSNRRSNERRWRTDPPEPLERRAERRREDRRSSFRAVRRVTVVEAPDGVVREFSANLSLEGAQFIAPAALISSQVEVRLQLPEMEELRMPGQVTRMDPVGRATAIHVRFDALDVRTELALARMLDAEAGAPRSAL